MNNITDVFSKILSNCQHKNIYFIKSEFSFRCVFCNELLVKFGGMIEYKLFCYFAGIDKDQLLLEESSLKK